MAICTTAQLRSPKVVDAARQQAGAGDVLAEPVLPRWCSGDRAARLVIRLGLRRAMAGRGDGSHFPLGDALHNAGKHRAMQRGARFRHYTAMTISDRGPIAVIVDTCARCASHNRSDRYEEIQQAPQARQDHDRSSHRYSDGRGEWWEAASGQRYDNQLRLSSNARNTLHSWVHDLDRLN